MNAWVRAASLALALALVACTSPEATRTRAGGPGGDTGNRGRVVYMHEGSEPYWHTPRLLADRLRAPVVAASDAESAGRTGGPAASPR
jgi:hypothetical protein